MIRSRDRKDIVTCLDGECMYSREVTLRLSEKKVNFFGPAGCSPRSNLPSKISGRSARIPPVSNGALPRNDCSVVVVNFFGPAGCSPNATCVPLPEI